MVNKKRLAKWVVAAAVLMILLLLALACLDIYLDGNAPGNLDEKGLHIAPVFSAEAVALRLEIIAPMLTVSFAVAVAASVYLYSHGERASENGSPAAYRPAKAAKGLKAKRLVILVVAVAFIVLGVMNGGGRDVLVKAVNICTECIGLG